jgi:hypothetical protein
VVVLAFDDDVVRLVISTAFEGPEESEAGYDGLVEIGDHDERL